MNELPAFIDTLPLEKNIMTTNIDSIAGLLPVYSAASDLTMTMAG
jgi:hypothetical protein